MESILDPAFIGRFVKFGVVGFLGLIIDFGVTSLLKEKMKVNKYFANVCGFSLAVVNNFILNKIWTFEDTDEAYMEQFLQFMGIAVIGLAINQGILYLLHHYLKMNFYLAKLFAIGVVVIWNFGLNYLVTFA